MSKNNNRNKMMAWGTMCGMVVVGFPAMAQEGYPLTGTWLGEWGPQGQGNFLTVILEWDGERVDGFVNPGPQSSEINAITLRSADWTVELDMNIVDGDGNVARWQGEGELRDIGRYDRRIVGTWRQNGESGRFTLVRQGR